MALWCKARALVGEPARAATVSVRGLFFLFYFFYLVSSIHVLTTDRLLDVLTPSLFFFLNTYSDAPGHLAV